MTKVKLPKDVREFLQGLCCDAHAASTLEPFEYPAHDWIQADGQGAHDLLIKYTGRAPIIKGETD